MIVRIYCVPTSYISYYYTIFNQYNKKKNNSPVFFFFLISFDPFELNLLPFLKLVCLVFVVVYIHWCSFFTKDGRESTMIGHTDFSEKNKYRAHWRQQSDFKDRGCRRRTRIWAYRRAIYRNSRTIDWLCSNRFDWDLRVDQWPLACVSVPKSVGPSPR